MDCFYRLVENLKADIGAIERGERNVTLRTMRTIADTLGVKIVELVRGCELKPNACRGTYRAAAPDSLNHAVSPIAINVASTRLLEFR